MTIYYSYIYIREYPCVKWDIPLIIVCSRFKRSESDYYMAKNVYLYLAVSNA
jgi:hypothetical protein